MNSSYETSLCNRISRHPTRKFQVQKVVTLEYHDKQPGNLSVQYHRHLLSTYLARAPPEGTKGQIQSLQKTASCFSGLHWAKLRNLLQNRFFKTELNVLKTKIMYLENSVTLFHGFCALVWLVESRKKYELKRRCHVNSLWKIFLSKHYMDKP